MGQPEAAAHSKPEGRFPGLVAAGFVLAIPIAVGALIGGLSFRGALIDEYAYALPAFRLASAGVLRATPTAIAPAFVPIFLSAGTSWLFGNSMWAARIWMPFALWGTGMLLFVTALRLRASRIWAFAVAMAVTAGPVALPLSGVLMTDIPYSLFVALACLLALNWWIKRDATRAAWVGVAAGTSILIRPLGAAIVVGCVAAPFLARWNRKRDGSQQEEASSEVKRLGVWEAFALCGVASLGVVGTLVLLSLQGGATVSMDKYGSSALMPSVKNIAKMTFIFPAYSWLYLALFLIGPGLALLIRSRESQARQGRPSPWGVVAMIAGPALAVIFALSGQWMPYMAWGSIVARNGIGGGDRQEYPTLLWIVVTLGVAAASAGLGWGLVAWRAGRAKVASKADRGPGPEGQADAGGSERLLLILAALQLIAAAPLGLALGDSRVGYDRYLIPVAVCIAPVVAARASRAQAKAGISLAVTALVIVLTIVGMQDWIAQRDAAWSRLEALAESGVPLAKIDGGFEWDSFHFGESEARPGARNSSLWWISEYAPTIDPEWALSNEQRTGYEVVEVVSWRSWTRSGRLYMMRRVDPQAG